MSDRGWNRTLCLLAMSVAAAACSAVGKRENAVALYDLGIGSAASSGSVAMVSRVEVRAPTWLASSAMQYRLDYRSPAQRQAFGESRWASAPAEMLERRLQQGFSAPPDGATAGNCRLRLELDEFAQVFDAPAASRAVVITRVELLPARGEHVIARRIFRLEEPAPSADAKGGVLAFRHAADRLTDGIADWLGSPGAQQGAAFAATCNARQN